MTTKPNLVSAFLGVAAVGLLLHLYGEDKPTAPAATEYATIRWSGKENTHIIRPGGQVEFIGAQLRLLQRPEKADDRSFYMNAALNGLVKEGYELVAFTSDEIIVKRTAR